MPQKYRVNAAGSIKIVRANAPTVEIPLSLLTHALADFDSVIEKCRTFEVNIFDLLGMRNLSAFIGELYAATVIKESKGLFRKNPHQDGYPDLLLMDEVGIPNWNALAKAGRLRDKDPFSPFPSGGIEVKATCGAVPTPAWFAKKKRIITDKPDIGDQRIEVLKGYDWKAHHRQTNNLLGIVWDFIDRKPAIIGLFYSAELTSDHWGKLIQPKEGGGKTTSVSIMTRAGVATMYSGWVCVIDDKRYLDFFDSHNNGSIFTPTFFT